ncbi:META domain-containing protein [Gordonia sp. CPCC 205515]|uniref:META domain-containing protein n=1 Tax=Gordonia sp. CPCC 205515 TaxID=3140791 RepID=UPI003AF38804
MTRLDHRLTSAAVGVCAVAMSVLGVGAAAAAPTPVPPPNLKPAPVPPHRTPNAIDGFTGQTYESVAVIGGTIPGGQKLVVAFGPRGRIGLNAGCNQHAGTASMAGDQLRIGQLVSTMMACPGPRAGADRWLASFTSVPLTWRAAGPVLILSSPRQTVILIRR